MSKQTKEIVHTLLTLATFLFIVSGMGIAEPNLINALTLRILTKDTSYRLHNLLLYPFTIVLFTHIYLTVAPRIYKERTSSEKE